MKTNIELHRVDQIDVVGAVDSATMWITFPLSADHTATVTAFISPEQALKLASDLNRVGARAQAIKNATLVEVA